MNAELRWAQVKRKEKYETITLGKSETVGHAWDFYFGQKKCDLAFLETLVLRGFDFVFIVSDIFSLLGEQRMHQKQFN